MGFCHEHIILPLSDLVKGERIHKYLRLIQEAEAWTPEQMAGFQRQRLCKLFEHVVAEVPFYRDWVRIRNLNPSFITLDQFPIVSKTIMREAGMDRFSSDCFPLKQRIYSRSSGSTGEPFSYLNCRSANSVNTASKLSTWYQAGYRLGMPYMKIANGARHGRLKSLQDLINRCEYVPFFSMDDLVLKEILERIERKKPRFIRSYPVPLFLLAQYRNKHNNDYFHKPLHVMTTGSTLPDAYRAEIERAFGCDIIDSYSCEGTPNTYETPLHDGYHVCSYYGIIEVLDDNNQPVTDGIGRVVSTDFWNYAHPFIRYDTQDLVEVRNGEIMRIMGRECESLVDYGGHRYTVHNFVGFFQEDDRPTRQSIVAYQVVKRKDGCITFRLVVNDQYTTKMERYIIDFWQQRLGVPVDIEIVDEIPLMKNNKRLTIIEE